MSRDIKDFVAGLGVGASIGNKIVRNQRADANDIAAGRRNPELEDFDARNDIPGNWGGVKGWMRRRKQDVLGGGGGTPGPVTPRVTTSPGAVPTIGSEDPQFAETYADGGLVDDETPMTPMPGPVDRLRALGRTRALQQTPMPQEPTRPAPHDEAAGEPMVLVPLRAIQTEGRTPMQRPTERMLALGQSGRQSDAGPMGVVRDPGETGSIPDAPPRAIDTMATSAEAGVQLPSAQPAAPAPAAAPGKPAGKAVAGTKGGKRKALRDQTRTEAFDENLDHDDVDNVLRGALRGGMLFAQHVFHLDKTGAIPQDDPMRSVGMKELMGGTGAATPDEVAMLDQAVTKMYPKDDFTGPSGEARKMLRRMEIIYRHASNNGLTDKANKMAFEIIQYAAGEAAKLGGQAVAAFKAGNIPQAQQLTARAYNQIPDGRYYAPSPDGKSAVISDVVTGKPVQVIPYSPEMLFNAALQISNRGGYWQHLIQRASMVTQKGKQKDPLQDELTRARIDLTKARTAKIAGGGSGRGGAAQPSADGVTAALDRIEQMRVPSRGTREGNTPPQGGGEPASDDDTPGAAAAAVSAAQDEVLDDQLIEQGGGEGGPRSGDGSPPRPANADANLVRRKDKIGTSRAAASAGAGQSEPFDPEGDGYDYETAKKAGLKPDPKTGHWPTRDPKTGVILKGKRHETFQLGIDEDAKLGYELSQGQDGRYYTQRPDPMNVPNVDVDAKGKRGEPTVDFDEPNPLEPFKGRNPYADILSDPKNAAYFASKQGRAQKSGILAKKQELDREYADWNKARKEAIKAAKAAAKAEEKEEKEGAKATYRKRFDPTKAEEYEQRIDQAIPELAEKTKGKPSILTDGTDPGTVRDLSLSLLTTNPDMSPAKSVETLTKLALAGTSEDEEKWRNWKPVGKDKAGNVVVAMDGKQYRMTPQTYVGLNKLIDERWRKNKPKTPSGKPGAVLGVTADDVSDLGSSAVDYFSGRKGMDKSVVGTGKRAVENTAKFFGSPADEKLEPVRRAIQEVMPTREGLKRTLRNWSNQQLPKPFGE